MGNQCCTKDTIEQDNGETLGGAGYSNLHGTQMIAGKMTARQLALIIKVCEQCEGGRDRDRGFKGEGLSKDAEANEGYFSELVWKQVAN